MAERVVQTCTVAGAVRLRSTPCVVTCNIFVLYCSWQSYLRTYLLNWGILQRSPRPP